MDSGPGFGGSCFKKDILNLVYLSRYYGLEEVASFWEGVVKINNWHQKRITEILVKIIWHNYRKKIVICGFSFKANTNDTRESAAIQICKELIDEGANLVIHDPKVKQKQISMDLDMEPINKKTTTSNLENESNNGQWEYSQDLNIFKNAHAVLILTEWEEYMNINWDYVAKKMVKPSWIFDSRSILNKEQVKNAGLNLWTIGDGSQL